MGKERRDDCRECSLGDVDEAVYVSAERRVEVSEVSTGLGATAPAAAPTATPSEISTGLTGGPATRSRASEQPTVHMPRRRCHQYCASVDQHLTQTHPGRPTSTTMRPRIVIADGDFNWSDAAIGIRRSLGTRAPQHRFAFLRRQAGIRQAREPA